MLSEIEYALLLGYELMQIYEAHVYIKSDFILRDFIQTINYFKTISSNCFENIEKDEIDNYCTYLNLRMGLDVREQKINRFTVKPNQAQRNYFKLLGNSLFGKFIQRSDVVDVKFVRSQEELSQSYFLSQTIDDFICPNENVCMLFLKKNVMKLPPNRKQNVYVGSQITAFARQTIHEHICKISALSDFKLYQVECDSIYFSGPENLPCPISLSHAIGDFKLEYKNVLSYYAFGPKHYSISTLNEDQSIQNISKFSGLCLKNEINENVLTPEIFDTYLAKFLENIECFCTFYHPVTKANFNLLTTSSNWQKFLFRNKVSKRRLVDKEDKESLTTYPFGYNPQFD